MKKWSSKNKVKGSGTVKIYDMIFDRMKALVDKEGLLPWQKPWIGSGMIPQNFVSKKAYRGINPWVLSFAGYDCPYWISFRQAKKLGGAVKKGEKGCPVVFWKWIEKKDPDNNDADAKKRFPLLRYYTVFNLVQCEGIYWNKPKEKDIPPIECCENIVKENQQPPEIQHGKTAAFYRPHDDSIGMPNRGYFTDSEEYYSTLFHELTHSTGHNSRLGRHHKEDYSHRFGSRDYSKEELVAEMGAAFLCAHAGIVNNTIDNSAAYIKHWMAKLEDNKKWLIHAAAQAQKSTDYILGVDYR